jgi:hypothetical protein
MKQYLSIMNKDSYIGPQMKVGYDLSILPQNIRRVLMKDTDEIVPRLRTDNKTDQQFWTEKLIAEMSGQRRVTGYPPPKKQYQRTPTKSTAPKRPPNPPKPYIPPPPPQKTLGQQIWDWLFN